MTDDSKPDDLTPNDGAPAEPGRASDRPGASEAASAGDARTEPGSGADAALGEDRAEIAGGMEPKDVREPDTNAAATPPVSGAVVRGTRRSDGGRTSVAGDAEEIPYVDDPISKWWVGLIIAVFVVIFAWALLFGRGGLLVGGPDEAAATPSPVATASASPSPAASVAPSPEPIATPVPTTEPEATREPEAMLEPARTPEPLLVPASTAEAELEPCPSMEPGLVPLPSGPPTSPGVGDIQLPCRTPEPSASPTG